MAKGQNGGQVWLWGHHAVRAALEAGRRQIYEVVVAPKHADEYRELANAVAARLLVVEAKKMDAQFGDEPHQGVAARVGALEQPDLADVLAEGVADLLLFLDQVTDPHNLGACVRSAAAFGAAAVVVPAHQSVSITPVVAKAASGALEVCPVVTVTNLNAALADAKEAGFWAVGLDGYAKQDLGSVDMKGKTALVMGSEGGGMRDLVRKNCDFLARIPMTGAVESLNVSVSAGVALYEVRRQRG